MGVEPLTEYIHPLVPPYSISDKPPIAETYVPYDEPCALTERPSAHRASKTVAPSLKVKVPPVDTGLPTALDVTETVTVTKLDSCEPPWPSEEALPPLEGEAPSDD